MNKIVILLLVICVSLISFAQKNKAPKTMDQAIERLKEDCPVPLQDIIKNTPNDNLIDLCFPMDGDYMTVFEWTNEDNKRSGIRKHLVKNGIEYNEHQQTVIMIAFKKYLNGQAINEQDIFESYRIIEDQWRREDKVRYSTDSLRGEYIPKDIADCFRQIDSFWNDTIKNEVRQMSSGEFSGRTHMGFGLWMRNNWHLWGGSRLSEYMRSLGIYHPDSMSGTILSLYYQYLTEEDFNLEEEIEEIRKLWRKSKNKEYK